MRKEKRVERRITRRRNGDGSESGDSIEEGGGKKHRYRIEPVVFWKEKMKGEKRSPVEYTIPWALANGKKRKGKGRGKRRKRGGQGRGGEVEKIGFIAERESRPGMNIL